MITGSQIAQSLESIIAGRQYTPDKPCNVRLPMTMRELIEGDFEASENLKQASMLRDHTPSGVRMVCGVGVDIKAVRRPVAPISIIDCRPIRPLLAAFYDWMCNEKRTVDIDHSLATASRLDWPIWKAFTDEIVKRTGCEYHNFFPQEEMIENDPEEWHEFWWDYAEMPLYWGGDGNEETVLFEVLSCLSNSDYIADMPEGLYQHYSEGQIQAAAKMLTWIWKKKKYDLMSLPWAEALASLESYVKVTGRGIYFDEPDEVKLEISGADDIQWLFDAGAAIVKMREGTYRLVRGCCDDNFWIGTMDELLELHDKRGYGKKAKN